MKTLILLITLILVFVLGYMLGTLNSRPHARRPVTSAPATNSSDPQ